MGFISPFWGIITMCTLPTLIREHRRNPEYLYEKPKILKNECDIDRLSVSLHLNAEGAYFSVTLSCFPDLQGVPLNMEAIN